MSPSAPRPTTHSCTQELSSSGSGRIPVLDGIRAGAVLIVIAFHFWQGFAVGPYTLVGKLAVWGQTGVDLFFVLSGFLITRVLLASKGSAQFLRQFYARRALRIFPVYYMTLLAFYVVWPLLGWSTWTPLSRQWWFWAYMQNIPATFAPSLAAGPGHFWSLAVEEHFYLLWPLLVMRLDRKQLLQISGLAVVISIMCRIVFIQYATFYFTLARLDGLAIGSALALARLAGSDGLVRFVKPARRILLFGGPCLAATQLLISGSGIVVVQVFKSTALALLYACGIVLAIESRPHRLIARVLSNRILASIGRYSYGMYVFHPFILGSLHRAGLAYSLVGLTVSVWLTYLAAFISWTLIESRFIALRRYFEEPPGQMSALLVGRAPIQEVVS